MALVSTCQFCPKGNAKYTCSRCNAPYCGVSCFQGETHRQCSESFYKDQVMAEIMSNSADGVDKATKLRTLEAIQKNFRESENHDDSSYNNNETELDSDDDDDLSSRLEGIDLEDTDKVWSLLTSEGK